MIERPRSYLSDLPDGVNRKLPGGGPWRILPECPARLHNSLSAGRGRNPRTRAEIHTRCICPRTLVLVLADNVKARVRRLNRKELAASAPVTVRRKPLPPTPAYLSNVKKVEIPDLMAGLCRTRIGQQIMDLASEVETGSLALFRKQAAKAMCEEECPVYAACLAWITSGTEQPAGSWGGIYAGMTATERVNYTRGKAGIKG
jgi:hypothetical protein